MESCVIKTQWSVQGSESASAGQTDSHFGGQGTARVSRAAAVLEKITVHTAQTQVKLASRRGKFARAKEIRFCLLQK